MNDHRYMARALQLARRGFYTTDPNPRVGCLIVKNGTVVGEGFHARAGEPHAEVHALRSAGDKAGGADVYITLEPCCHYGRTPPCVDALIEAGVRRVIVATLDPNPQVAGKGLERLKTVGIDVTSLVNEKEARRLNRGFFHRMELGRPWVRIKSGLSLDGRTAMASGESQWITGKAARRDVQFLRARSSAILTGSGTVTADDPSLNVRLHPEDLGISGKVRQPLRIVLDTELKLPHNARMLSLPGQCLVFTTSGKPEVLSCLEGSGVEVVTVSRSASGVNLEEVMRHLVDRELNEVQVEAGSVLCGALLKQHLVDELVLYMAPHLMGAHARGLADLDDIQKMSQRLRLRMEEVRFVGEDLKITAAPRFAEKV